MRSSKSRSRSKSNRQRSLGNIINRVFDSSGPEGKVRGTPQQIIDKYLMLARDAQLSNDRVAEQAFLQHAEHYTRLLGEAQREMAREQEGRQPQGGNAGYGNGNGNGNGNGGQPHAGDNAPRDRQEQPRPTREEDSEQPDFAPLGEVAAELAADDGPGLVETPEMYHAAAEPRSEPRAESAGPAPKGDRQPRRGERGPRGPRKPRAERPADAQPGEPAAEQGAAPATEAD